MKSLNVLIVDDEPLNREVAQVILAREGHRVETSDTGAEALELCRDDVCPYDVILMDIYMPVMDGVTATRALRGRETTRHVPVIFITGTCQDGDEEAAQEAGGTYFMRKPFRRSELLSVIERVLAEESSGNA
jgi:CheY-like chemotaxis protein